MKRVALLALLVLMAGRIAQASEPLSPIQQAMLRIRDERIEHIVVFNNKGELIAESVGAIREALYPNTDYFEATTLHNHPNGTPWFSVQDYLSTYAHWARRTIVISAVQIKGWKIYTRCTFERPININWAALDAKAFKQQANKIGFHAAWSQFAAINNLIYECEFMP